MKFYLLFFFTLVAFSSCDRIKSKTKETINKGGEMAGEAASEFVEGFSDGVDESFSQEIQLSENLKNKGLRFGSFSIKNDSVGVDNMLSIYLIFEEDFDTEISAQAFNEKGLEIGRSKTKIIGEKGTSEYFEFRFNEQTRIDGKSKIVLE